LGSEVVMGLTGVCLNAGRAKGRRRLCGPDEARGDGWGATEFVHRGAAGRGWGGGGAEVDVSGAGSAAEIIWGGRDA